MLSNDNRSVKLSTKVIDFKKNIIKSRLNDLKHENELLDENDLINLSKTYKSFDVMYPSIGENFSFLKRLVKKDHIL